MDTIPCKKCPTLIPPSISEKTGGLCEQCRFSSYIYRYLTLIGAIFGLIFVLGFLMSIPNENATKIGLIPMYYKHHGFIALAGLILMAVFFGILQTHESIVGNEREMNDFTHLKHNITEQIKFIIFQTLKMGVRTGLAVLSIVCVFGGAYGLVTFTVPPPSFILGPSAIFFGLGCGWGLGQALAVIILYHHSISDF